MRDLLRDIHARGYEIGIHPGYNTYCHPEAMARSVTTLRRVLDEEGIRQPLLGGRQHYLRWETPTTARLWGDNELPAVSMELVAIRDLSGITRLPSNNVMLG